jgi:predicted dehydrogenase
MTALQRLGVIGLGSGWHRRYLPVLLRLHERFAVTAVCDPVHERAAVEARRLGCAATAGPTELLGRQDVDALLLLDAGWQRLWPVEAACRARKPVLCVPSLQRDEANADRLLRQVQESSVPVLVACLPRLAPATARLRELLETQLGPARLVLSACMPAAVQADWPPLPIALLDWCASFLPGDPLRVRSIASAALGVTDLVLEYAEGRGIHLIARPAAPPLPVRLEVLGERGRVFATLPNRIAWRDGSGKRLEILPRRPQSLRLLLEHFHRVLVEGEAPAFSLADAGRVLGWLRAAQRSQTGNGWIDLPSGNRGR